MKQKANELGKNSACIPSGHLKRREPAKTSSEQVVEHQSALLSASLDATPTGRCIISPVAATLVPNLTQSQPTRTRSKLSRSSQETVRMGACTQHGLSGFRPELAACGEQALNIFLASLVAKRLGEKSGRPRMTLHGFIWFWKITPVSPHAL